MFYGPHSDEAKKAIGDAHKGKKLSEHCREQISEGLTEYWSKIPLDKRAQDPEHIEARRQKLLGKKHSDAAKKKNSESRKAAWVIQKANGYCLKDLKKKP